MNPKSMTAPGGHYSHAVRAGGLVFVSGQLPVTAQGHTLKDAPFGVQARQSLDNCRVALAEAGCRFVDVVKTTVFIRGIEHWQSFNTHYSECFGSHRPARSVVPVPELHFGYLIEIEMVAWLADVPENLSD
ncbi:MAG: RidA family protein [Betaproteobacteria bacterium]|nr:RidA family protein [Betaproteobacteria bacterium]